MSDLWTRFPLWSPAASGVLSDSCWQPLLVGFSLPGPGSSKIFLFHESPVPILGLKKMTLAQCSPGLLGFKSRLRVG